MRRFIAGVRAWICVLMLALTATSCSSTAEDAHPLILTGGNPAGVYYAYATQLAQAMQRDLAQPVVAQPSDGSVENLLRVGEGHATFGFAQADAAADAMLGEGKFTDPLPINAVARVYDEYVHVVVAERSPVRTVADLAEQPLSLGARGSGVQVIAERVLEAAGVEPSQVNNHELDLEASIEALQRGEIEAFFWVGGLPTPGIQRLQDAFAVRLLSIDAEVVDLVNAGHAGVYQLADFPVESYGLSDRTTTMAVPNYLVTHESVSAEVVYLTLRVLFDARAEIAREVAATNTLDERQAIFTGPLPLHTGAAEFYRDRRH